MQMMAARRDRAMPAARTRSSSGVMPSAPKAQDRLPTYHRFLQTVLVFARRSIPLAIKAVVSRTTAPEHGTTLNGFLRRRSCHVGRSSIHPLRGLQSLPQHFCKGVYRARTLDPVKRFLAVARAKHAAGLRSRFSARTKSPRNSHPLFVVFDQPKEGLIMWLGLIVSLVYTYQIIEMIEEWRIRRSAKRDLREMRKHVAAGH